MRKPARLQLAGALTPRDQIWSAIRMFGTDNTFSIAELMVLTTLRADTIDSYLQGLAKAGYIAPLFKRHHRRELTTSALRKDIGAQAPRVDKAGKPVTQGIGREQMWRSARVLKSFTAHALALNASTEEHVVSVEEAKTYARFLERAGYLRLEVASRSGSVAKQYRFLPARNTGPRAPMVTRDKSVIDANTGETMLQGGAHAE